MVTQKSETLRHFPPVEHWEKWEEKVPNVGIFFKRWLALFGRSIVLNGMV